MTYLINKKGVYDFIKGYSEKGLKGALDKNWLKYHSEIARYNPELKKLKKADFLAFAKVTQGSSYDDFEKYLSSQSTKVKLSKSESEGLSKGLEVIMIALSVGMDMLQILAHEEQPVVQEVAEKKAA